MSDQSRPVTALTVVGVLTFLVSAGTLTSGYAFDDLPIIVNNFRVHALLPPWTYFTQTYWPPEMLTALYRPVTIFGLALQWNAAGDAAWLFHAVSLVARTVVLGGLAGDMANIAIRDVSSVNRIITMLGVVPHWFRLLLEPWHWQADYTPRELDLATAPGPMQYLGIALLAATTGGPGGPGAAAPRSLSVCSGAVLRSSR